MLFNSFTFLAFFAVLVVVYYFLPHRFRWILLVAASLYFYFTFNASYVLLLLASALIAYLAGLAIGGSPAQIRKQAALAVGIFSALAPLIIFKYLDFFSDSFSSAIAGPNHILPKLGWLLPAGLSFYTFSCISYIIDVYRGQLAPERHIGRLTLYVSFFPKLLAGPIERATSFLPQLSNPIRFSSEQVTQGLQLMLWGLFKKVVIADRLAPYVDASYKNPDFASPVSLWIASYFFAFQIYCDFSGYSDIAIGAARVLGFNLMENFRRAYLATSVPEFWGKDRWHISLSRWFRDYMYVPIGGSRVSQPRMYFNQMAVFVMSGLWHGANWTFVIWGGLNGVFQILTVATDGIRDKIAKKLRFPAAVGSLLGGLVTFHLILISWVFFRAASISEALTILSRMSQSLPRLPNLLGAYIYSEDIVLSLVLIAVLVTLEAIDEKRSLWERLQTQPVYVRWAVYYVLIFCLIILGKWDLKQFVYMQF